MSVRWDCCKISLQAPPLDYSFRGISFIQDLLTEEPRAGLKVIKRSAGGKLLTQAVRLNNNTINELTDFASTMEQLLEYPDELSWVDLSFNDLPTIDPVLTTYPNLRALNLHGNSIQSLSEVDKLAVLPHLRTLTLHGNPIEEEKGYRWGRGARPANASGRGRDGGRRGEPSPGEQLSALCCQGTQRDSLRAPSTSTGVNRLPKPLMGAGSDLP
ncbi:Leucine-rich repeat-containing protein 51 [Platysternon megacephalum]|uniref:Leucine-rich repeat-containing protein 51 n=1 Tax=Platysternon megacephalum TaxID=55544 RepID=A0A4D9DZE2_9SAUR|nr:Leucine-rich repeat-containing protein 51 [Platysternon megacephalum]